MAPPLPIKFTETLNLTSVGILVSTTAIVLFHAHISRARVPLLTI